MVFWQLSTEHLLTLVSRQRNINSVMMGARRSVIELLKVEVQADWILSVWCLAHRLELAVKDCFKGTFTDNNTEMLTLIYYFNKGSAKRNKEVAEVADIMEEHFLSLKKQTELGGWITSYDLQPS